MRFHAASLALPSKSIAIWDQACWSQLSSLLGFELKRLGLRVEEQKSLPVIYKDVKLDCGYRLDLVVEDEIIIEIKAVEKLLPIYDAQLLSYLRLSNKRVGLLMNFRVSVLKNGLK
jgi:GxxExxY protein